MGQVGLLIGMNIACINNSEHSEMRKLFCCVGHAQVVSQIAEMAPSQAATIRAIAGPLVSISELAFIVR